MRKAMKSSCPPGAELQAFGSQAARRLNPESYCSASGQRLPRMARKSTGFGIGTLAILLSGCASATPKPHASDASDSISPHLACARTSNCVNSLGTGSLLPLRYTGTPAQAMAMLHATLKTFPEARVVRSEDLALEVIFTTPVGFRDQVDFRIDAQRQRIEFRSRSLFGLFDWGKTAPECGIHNSLRAAESALMALYSKQASNPAFFTEWAI